MFTNQPRSSNCSSMSKWLRQIRWLVLPVIFLTFTIAHAQNLTATLSGIVNDQMDARIPGAKVVITNEASGDNRETKTDVQGFFSVTALPPGSYKVTISASNFASWEMNGIVLNQGDSRTVPSIHLKIGSEATAVTVISGADAEVPVDTAEVSATLNNELVDSATLTGRNAAELIKMMPGVTFSGNTSSYNSQVTGTNNGPAGSFSANGTQPYGSTDVYLDGANLIDPGNAGTQVANINQDMTDSVKYLSASYGAEFAKGPAVLQAFSKSGGQKFHGEGYFYARNTAIGYANDWYNKSQQIGSGKPNSLTDQHFYYVGGNIGGPVFFPHFNHNRDKLFFWAGYEYMDQHPYNAPVTFNVPTADQRKGDFSSPGIAQGIKNTYPAAYNLPCNNSGAWDQGCSDPVVSPWNTPGQDFKNLSAYFDPNGILLSNLSPAANQTPAVGNGWNNFTYSPNTPQNRWEVTGKVTYSFNDNNKLWGSYTYQSETDNHPLSIWWAPEWTIPYPADPVGKEKAHVYLANFTHVFSPTTTNEVVFAYSEFINNNSLSNPAGVSRAKLNFPVQSIFGTTNDQIPNVTGGWNSGLSEIREFDFNSGIYGKGTFGKTSKAPSIADTFTKIIGTHSVKAGFYWDTQENLQANGGDLGGNTAQGGYDFETWGYTTTQNVLLDELMGRPYSYTEENLDLVPDILWHQWSLWAQDSWKASRKLTLNYGLRADHMGQWYDKLGGVQVWDAASYDNSSTPPANTGLLWHEIDSKIPESGWSSVLFYYNPRLGVAYDIHGTGKTVLRAGFGTYRYQVSGNDGSAAMNGPIGQFGYGTGSEGVSGLYGFNIQGGKVCTYPAAGGISANCDPVTGFHQLAVPPALNQNHTTINADKQGDNKTPYANTFSFGVAQALPGHTVAEVSYVGSTSHNQLINGNNGRIFDQNETPLGAFFTPDPKTGDYNNIAPNCPGCTGANNTDWRPLNNYGPVYLHTHGGHANYNSLQVSAQKQSGNLYMFTNFTFGKVLGTRDGSTSNGNGNGTVINPFDLDSNYGPLGYDHTKVFNLSFSYKLPSPIHDNWALRELINGWQISNYTTYQDGAPYQANSGNMNAIFQQVPNTPGTVITMPFPASAPNGNTTTQISASTWYGSNQYESGGPIPLVVCDPRKHLLKNQYFNPNCFAAPLPPTESSMGQMGQFIWPYIRTPHYFDSDLALFKAFRVNDSQRIEFRVSMTNWLNHPNPQFGIAGNSDNQLLFSGVSSAQTLIYNSNTSTTGIPENKQGYRWTQFAAKYYF